jgi:hypothetical protein
MRITPKVSLCCWILVLSLCCWILMSAEERPSSAEEKNTTKHNWSYIAYPYLPPRSEDLLMPTKLTLENHKEHGLQFILRYTYVFEGPAAKYYRQKRLPRPNEITVRLHTAGGKVTYPRPDENRRKNGWGHLGVTEFPDVYEFPWSRNVWEEAAIALHFPGGTYWLDIPYGFTRDPAAPLTPGEVRRARPLFAAPPKKLGEKRRLLPWLRVHYDLGQRVKFRTAGGFGSTLPTRSTLRLRSSYSRTILKWAGASIFWINIHHAPPSRSSNQGRRCWRAGV